MLSLLSFTSSGPTGAARDYGLAERPTCNVLAASLVTSEEGF